MAAGMASRNASRICSGMVRKHGQSIVQCGRSRGGGCSASSSSTSAPTTSLSTQLAAAPGRRYVLVGGKGGVGKTSMSAALAVRMALAGHKTLIVSTDPAHSLSDSLGQNVAGGQPVPVQGMSGGSPLYGLELDPEDARDELRAFSSSQSGQEMGKGVKDFMGTVGLGGILDQIADLRLGELLETPPPGLDEAMAISKVVKFMESEEYSDFSRIIFDTAPTGHTLRLLTLPEFLDKSIGKVMKLRKNLMSASSAIKSVLGLQEEDDETNSKLEALKARLMRVSELFKDAETTEFIIVTIPTMMALTESGKLLRSLRHEGVPVKHMILNQIVPAEWENIGMEVKEADVSAGVKRAANFCQQKRRDQERAMDLISQDAGLRELEVTEGPLFDIEIRGVPALQYLGDTVYGRD